MEIKRKVFLEELKKKFVIFYFFFLILLNALTAIYAKMEDIDKRNVLTCYLCTYTHKHIDTAFMA